MNPGVVLWGCNLENMAVISTHPVCRYTEVVDIEMVVERYVCGCERMRPHVVVSYQVPKCNLQPVSFSAICKHCNSGLHYVVRCATPGTANSVYLSLTPHHDHTGVGSGSDPHFHTC